MSTAASAVTTVDSAPTPETPAVLPELSSLTPEQRQTWRETGELPTLQDSAPAKKEKVAAADSAPQKDEKKTAPNASDSATDNDTQKPHRKTKEDTERRFQELLDRVKRAEERAEALERKSQPEKREQASQPAPEAKAPNLKTFLEQFFAKAENKGKNYEDGVEAWAEARDKDRGKQVEAQVRQQIAAEQAQRELNSKVEDAKQRYPDWEQRIQPAVKAITEDQSIPMAVKALINDSPVFVDLLYVLGEADTLKDLISTAKANPTAALRRIALTEQLVEAELAKQKGSDKAPDKSSENAAASDDGEKSTPERDGSGKFVSAKASEPISRAPKPPAELGGGGTPPADAVAAALKATPGKLTRSAKEALNRLYAEGHR